MFCSVKGCRNQPVYMVEVIWKKKSLWFSRCQHHIIENYQGKVKLIRVENW
jgi:hypothetical protein